MEVNGNGIAGDPELEALAIASRFTGGQIELMILKVAVDLDIPEIMWKHGEAIKFSDLAAFLPQIPSSRHEALRRVMYTLCTMQLVEVERPKPNADAAADKGDELFALTLAGAYYTRGYEKSLVHMQSLFLTECSLRGWHSFGSWLVQEEVESSFELGNGDTLWGCASKNSDFNATFNKAMTCNSKITCQALVQNCPEVFAGVESLVDVGGGTGNMVKAVCAAFPSIKATVFDLPHVIKDQVSVDAPQVINFVSGDMFEFVPKGDTILLKEVLHDWDDRSCLKIIKRCKEALTDGGKILIVDIVLGMGEEKVLNGKRQKMDIVMLGLYGIGKERTEKEWDGLLSGAGFSHHQIKPIKIPQSLIIAYP